jgi:glycosyltransferase involved in cell wall biosynthesis
MTPPYLTVALPTWNRAARLETQLAGLLAGTARPDLEVLVGDNGSTDATPAVVAAAAGRDGRVRSYRTPANLGCDANYLRLIEQAAGEWVWLLGDDEPVDPAQLPALVEALKDVPADAVHLVPATMRQRASGAAAELTIETLLAQFYYLPSLMAVSTVVLRRTAALPFLIDGYRVAGHLHAYTGVILAMLRAGGRLRLLDLPVLTSYGGVEAPRWPSVRAHLGAWWTMRRGLPHGQRCEADRREARARLGDLLKGLQSAAEQGSEPLDPDDLGLIVGMVPPEQRDGVRAFCDAVIRSTRPRAGCARAGGY